MALVQAGLLCQGARLDRVDEAAPCVAPEQGELGGEAVAGQRGVLHCGPWTPHVPHGRDGWPEGSGLGNETGFRQLELGHWDQDTPKGCHRPWELPSWLLWQTAGS